MTEQTRLERLLDAGAAADWTTPASESLRNPMQNGASFTVTADEWRLLQPILQQHRIPYWGVAMHRAGEQGRWVCTFSVRVEDRDMVEWLAGIQANGGRIMAFLMLAFVLLILAGTTVLAVVVAAVGKGV